VITQTAIEKSGIVSLTRSNPFAFSYAIAGEVAAAVLQRNAIAIVNVVRVIATVSYHFVIAVWRTNEAESMKRAIMPVTYPEILDTSVKIGLGALIAASSAYLMARLGYRREAEKVYIAAKRAHLDKVIELLNDFHKVYPPVRSAMDHHFRRIEKGEQDTVQQKEEFETRRTTFAERFSVLPVLKGIS
jgi:hypothetical protein